MSAKKIDTQIVDHKVIVTLNREDKRNAFDQEMIAELTEAFQKAAELKSARVLLLKGAGKSFSAGADLQWMKSMVKFSVEDNKKDSVKLRNMFLALQNVPYPAVALVQGHVMGGALGLIAACDIVAAVAGTKFCFSEVKLGLSPAVVSEFVAPKIPRSHLSRLFLTADLFDAKAACDFGLAHFEGSVADAETFVDSNIHKILQNGPQAVRATKQLIQKLYKGEENFSEYSTDLIANLRVSKEGQAGLGAFFAKQSPDWEDA